MLKLDHINNNSEKSKQDESLEEQKKFIKEIKNSKIVPINDELECTLSHGSIASSISKKLSNVKNKLLSFSSERMTTEFNNRYTFIRNVFFLLCLQSVTSIIFVAIALRNEKLGKIIKNSREFRIIVPTALGIFGLIILLFRNILKIKKLEWVFYCLFTITKSFVAIDISETASNHSTIAIHVMFSGVCLSLVLYSIFSREKFKNQMALLITLLSCTIFFGISFLFTKTSVTRIFYMYIGVLIFSCFIVYDVQLIAGGRFQDFNYDDYVTASLIVFVEIIGVFFYILKLFREPI